LNGGVIGCSLNLPNDLDGPLEIAISPLEIAIGVGLVAMTAVASKRLLTAAHC
jgi:hypothetical protein